MATAEQGVSARQLARALDLGSYETAWTMLHRFRRAMVRSGRPKLVGRVEIGTVAAPGRPDPAGGSFPSTAAIALEDRGETPGRVRMQRLPSGAGDELVAFLGRVVEPGTLVRAVRLETWWPLAELGFMTERAPSLTHLPAVERALAGGCAAPTTAPPRPPSSTGTWTSSPSASTAAARPTVACSSTASWRRPW